MTVAYIGLGGNVGDVVSNMAGALCALDLTTDSQVVSVSRVYRTPPWGIEDQDWFHNACAALETTLQPIELLEECLKIEKLYNRKREIRWGPRTLDLDVLLFGDETVDIENLTVPHPRMHERGFVMKPLEEIAPDIKVFGKVPAYWLEKLEDLDVMQSLELDSDWWRSGKVTD